MEENAGALINTWKAVEERFAPWLSKMSWFNLGGGHHITRADYRVDQLVELIRGIRDRYAVDVILEPGEAIPFDCGFLVSEVQDTLFNGMPIAILDVSAACHMPDVLEMPYQPHVFLLDKTADGVQYRMAVRCSDQGEVKNRSASEATTCRLTGPTCLAGDVIGDYVFPRALRRGDRLVFLDMGLYTMVKTNTFNGMPLPDLALTRTNGETVVVRQFSYDDFRDRLG